MFCKKRRFKNIKFIVKVRDICKIEKNILSQLLFLFMKTKKYPIYESKKCCVGKHVIYY